MGKLLSGRDRRGTRRAGVPRGVRGASRLLPPGPAVEAAQETIRTALAMHESEREKLRERSRAYVEREHSLSLLVEKLVGILSK